MKNAAILLLTLGLSCSHTQSEPTPNCMQQVGCSATLASPCRKAI